MSENDRRSYYQTEELENEVYGPKEDEYGPKEDAYSPNNNNSLYSNGTLHYCSIYRYVCES